MKDVQQKLVAAWTDYVAGTIDAKALKGASAGFGIYQQRDDKTMMRIRRVGGLLTTKDLRNAAAILRAHGGAFAHLTTRQDIQLHGIPADQVTRALETCETVGFPFRGGGGFKPRLGLKLFDALPAADCIRVAMALTALFNDRGCRTNRAHARIRFLREDLGDDGLVALFHAYLAKLPADVPQAIPGLRPLMTETSFAVSSCPSATSRRTSWTPSPSHWRPTARRSSKCCPRSTSASSCPPTSSSASTTC